jgi:hypothetical protein
VQERKKIQRANSLPKPQQPKSHQIGLNGTNLSLRSDEGLCADEGLYLYFKQPVCPKKSQLILNPARNLFIFFCDDYGKFGSWNQISLVFHFHPSFFPKPFVIITLLRYVNVWKNQLFVFI